MRSSIVPTNVSLYLTTTSPINPNRCFRATVTTHPRQLFCGLCVPIALSQSPYSIHCGDMMAYTLNPKFKNVTGFRWTFSLVAPFFFRQRDCFLHGQMSPVLCPTENEWPKLQAYYHSREGKANSGFIKFSYSYS